LLISTSQNDRPSFKNFNGASYAHDKNDFKDCGNLRKSSGAEALDEVVLIHLPFEYSFLSSKEQELNCVIRWLVLIGSSFLIIIIQKSILE
jgi:hypothetical protein